MTIRKRPTTLLPLCFLLPSLTFAQQPSTGTAQTQPAPAPSSQKPAPTAQPETPLNTSDAQISLQLFYWQPFTQPDLHGGKANVGPYEGDLKFPGSPKRAPGAVLSFPAGKNNTLRFSYFRLQGDGNTTSPGYRTLFNTDFNPGDYLVTRYEIQNVKLSYDFLSYPFPPNPSRFRLKTLWEVQYTTIRSSIDAPLKPIQTDASGNVISNTATGTRSLIYPSFGVAIEKAFSGHFRVEAKASGFAIPHRSVTYDTEASAVFRTGHYEIAVGARDFHFKTSPQNAQYFVANFPGVFVAFRYYLQWPWH